MTTQQFIDRTLTLLNRLRPGQGAGPSESNIVLDLLKQMLDSWNTEHLSCFHISTFQKLLTNGKNHYSFGPGGDFTDVARFVKIQKAGIIRAGMRIVDLELINSKQWEVIQDKQAASLLPIRLYNDNAFPATTCFLWPTPSNNALTGGTGDADLLWRVLDIKDTAVGDDTAEHQPVQADGQGTVIEVVLRKTIASDLTVEVVKAGITIGTVTVPSATAIDQVITLDISTVAFIKDEVITWNITASDGSADAGGVASVNVYWLKTAPVVDVGAAYLELSVWQQIAAPDTLGTTIEWPSGYSLSVMYNLAVEVADAFPGITLKPEVVAIAKMSKDNIQKLNMSNNIPVEDMPPAPPSTPATVQESH